MITLNRIHLRRGQYLLLKDVSWTIYHKQRIGLIGANGSGKSSLFSVLLGELEPDNGTLDIPASLKLGHVAQETPPDHRTAVDYILTGDTELQQLEASLRIAEEKDDGQNIALLHARLGEIDAYTARARAAQLLAGLGFNQTEQQQPVSYFSGGWRVRLNLAKALMSRSDVLLLDEPTNHLDLDAVIWLENWLMHYPGTLILISHDRTFLDHVVHQIAHIKDQTLTLYSGNYSAFEKQRAANLLLQQASYEKQQKHIKHLQQFIDRFKAKASKARQAQSRMKALERMDVVNAVQTDSAFQFHFKEPKPAANPLLSIEQGKIAYGDKIVLHSINLSIAPGDRLALIGPNGAGKSSLIRLIAGEIAATAGRREVSRNVQIGYLAQHQVEQLNLDETPLERIRNLSPGTPDQALRTHLGSFGFSHQRVNEKLHLFSGGEKTRFALALLIWQRPNLILLDEPTNHLDLEMRQALSIALQDYTGAMILVSHDRFLVETTADQLILVANHELTPFDGDLQDYEKWLLQFRRKKPDVLPTPKPDDSPPSQKQLDAASRESRRPLLQKLKKIEQEIEMLQRKLTDIESHLSGDHLYEPQHKKQLHDFLTEQTSIQKRLSTLEEEWLQLSETLHPKGE